MKLHPPITKVDRRIDGTSNARHGPFSIRIWKDVAEFDAVLAQEIYEWQFMALRAVPFLAVSLALIVFVHWLFLPTLVVAILLPRKIPAWQREMEFRGHAVEVVVSVAKYGRDFEEKLNEEVRSLTRYKQFKGWSEANLDKEVRKRLPLARKWATKNYK